MMTPRKPDIDLPDYENQYGNGFLQRSRNGVHRYQGDLPEYVSQFGSGRNRRKQRTVSFYSPRQGKVVTFKASPGKIRRKKFRYRLLTNVAYKSKIPIPSKMLTTAHVVFPMSYENPVWRV